MLRLKNIYFFLVGLFVLTVADSAAQNNIDKKYFSEDLLMLYNPLLVSSNSASLCLYRNSKMSVCYSDYILTQGKNKAIREAEDIGEFHIGTYSYQNYKGLGLYGRFDYVHSMEDAVKYRNLFSYHSRNPLILGDTVGGEYHKELFHLQASVSYPLIGNNLLGGLGIDYVSAVGAKDNDPRPMNNLMRAKINPGLIWNADNMVLGGSFSYIREKEEINMRCFTDNNDCMVFDFRGLGFYKSFADSNYDRNYFTDTYDFTLNGGIQGERFSNMTKFSYAYTKTTVDDGKASIRHLGNYQEELISGESYFTFKQSDSFHKIKLYGNITDGITMMNVLRQETDGFGTLWRKYGQIKESAISNINTGIVYSFHKMRSYYRQDWKAELSVEYEDNYRDYYFTPVKFKDDYSNLLMGISALKGIELTESSLLTVYLSGALRTNLSDNLYMLNDNNKDDFRVEDIEDYMVKEIALTDNAYNTGKQIIIDAYLRYSFDIKINNLLSAIYMKLGGKYIESRSGMLDGKSRSSISFSAGMVF